MKNIFWLGPLSLLLLSVSLNACLSSQESSPSEQEPISSSITPQPPVIEATPLPPSRQPPRFEVSSTQSSPWLTTEFLASLQSQGASATSQGLWVQSSTQAIAAHQSGTRLPAASVTKIATTVSALHQLGPNFRFVTQVGRAGAIANGTLQGDLIVAGGDDPFFVWEDAFKIAALLEAQGIQSISGDLIIQAPFVMNFEDNPDLSGTLLRQSLDSQLWPEEAIAQFNALPAGAAKPNISISGTIRFVSQPPQDTTWLIRHQSLPLVELLKRMNRYSNNPMADQIANYLGGAEEVTRIVRSLTGLSSEEVNFINGSGLGPENQITPQGATLMLQALSNLLQEQGLSLGDVMTIVGQDEGILDERPLPSGLVVKSGTLDQVSALAGVLPTQSEGPIWFSILNYQGSVDGFRQNQERLLQKMATTWGRLDGEKLLAPTLDPNQLQTITQPL